MTKVFTHYAKCNQHINDNMIKVLTAAKENAYDLGVDGYFKSIGDILDHIYKADLTWLTSFRTIREYSIFKDPAFNAMPKGGERMFTDLGTYAAARAHLDTVFIRLADEIEEADLDKLVVRVTRMGERQEKLFWKALIHVFNHQTHHRGQVSQILDQLKIENDYSNMIRIE